MQSQVLRSLLLSPPSPLALHRIAVVPLTRFLTLSLSLTAPLNQAVRTRTSEEFRSASKGIMFSSDVTARGLDYPDVTLVLQVRHRERERGREGGVAGIECAMDAKPSD